MHKNAILLTLLNISLYFIKSINSHGYLADPPARSSAWMFDDDFSKCCQYYDHNQMFCGGAQQQWNVNGGKCSICGEAYDLKTPLFSKGGSMYLGKIVRTYTQGSTIPVTVVLTANHLGIFEFRVCSLDNDSTQDATQNCLDLNVLQVGNGLTQFKIESSFRVVNINVTLPSKLLCKHCVFQWKYRTGNSWGQSNGQGCLGCGSENEEFYGCSDISIVNLTVSKLPESTTKLSTVRSTTVINRKCKTSVVSSQRFDIGSILDSYCETICANNCAGDNTSGNEIIYKGCVDSCGKICTCQ